MMPFKTISGGESVALISAAGGGGTKPKTLR